MQTLTTTAVQQLHLCLYLLLHASHMLAWSTFNLPLQPNPSQTSPQPSPALAPPDASHLLGAHQEADPLASVGVGQCIDMSVGAGWARGAVSGQTGQVILGAVVLGQLPQVLQPPLVAQLKSEQRLELQSLYGAQEDHGVWRTKKERLNDRTSFKKEVSWSYKIR